MQSGTLKQVSMWTVDKVSKPRDSAAEKYLFTPYHYPHLRNFPVHGSDDIQISERTWIHGESMPSKNRGRRFSLGGKSRSGDTFGGLNVGCLRH